MDSMDFQHVWETEYISTRVKKVTEAVEDGNYERAINFLQMIQEKAKQAEMLLKNK